VLREFAWAAATGFVGMVLGALALGINLTTIGQRWQTNTADDQVQHYLVATTVTDNPFLGPNSRMGFPTTQNLFFAPNYDPASAVFMWFESLFTSNGILILNVYYLLGFFTVAFASYFFFQSLRIRRWLAIVFALIFALAPYHFQRVSYGHAFVSNYWAVPLLGILILMVAGPRTNPFERWVVAAPTRAGQLWRRLVPLLVITLLVSLSLSYYYVFGAIILGGILLARAIRVLVEREKLSTLIWPAVTIGSLALFIVVQLAVLSLNFGDRYLKYFGVRSPAESEWHAGKLTSLLLPWNGTGFDSLAAITNRYIAGSDVSIFAEPPGTPIVAAGAMLLIIAFVLVRLLQPRPVAPTTAFGRFFVDERTAVLSMAFIWSLLFYMVAGLGAIFAFLISPEIRAWTRLSIVMTMLALAFLAILIDMVVKRLRFSVPLVAFLVLIAIVDQLIGAYKNIDLQPTDDASLRSFVAEAEDLLDDNCGVVQLPLKGFPASGPVGNMSDYNQVLPYVLATDNSLRWSYGAVYGTTSGDFWGNVQTPADFEAAVEESEACAIEVDLFAYPNEADTAVWKELVNTVADAESPAIVSTDPEHRYLLFTVDTP
jgi:hypothetical protein